MKKRLISMVMALLLLCSISVVSFAASNPNEVRNSVVRIVQVFTADGISQAWSYGSGFFVGESGEKVRYLVTNNHVVDDFLGAGAGAAFTFTDDQGYKHTGYLSVRVYFDANDYVEAYAVDNDVNQDIAVLRLDNPTDKREPVTLQIPDESMVGDNVYVIGYPANADDYANPTSIWGSEDSLVSKGTLGRLYTESATGARWIQSSDMVFQPGNSGGPLVLENGNCIGLVSWGYDGTTSQTMNMGVNIESVVEMLSQSSVKFDLADGSSKKQDSAEPAEPTEPAEPAEPTPAPEESGFDWHKLIVPGIIALAVILIAIIVIVLVSKSKKPAPAPVPAPAPQPIRPTVGAPGTMPQAAMPQQRHLTPSVRSLSSQHGGKKVKIGNQPIILGRATDCQIVFAENTPGVSGRHCAVTWDVATNEFIVKDMNSTYGTYLDSGMKLDPNRVYRLKAGDSFYLGDKANALRVEIE